MRGGLPLANSIRRLMATSRGKAMLGAAALIVVVGVAVGVAVPMLQKSSSSGSSAGSNNSNTAATASTSSAANTFQLPARVQVVPAISSTGTASAGAGAFSALSPTCSLSALSPKPPQDFWVHTIIDDSVAFIGEVMCVGTSPQHVLHKRTCAHP